MELFYYILLETSFHNCTDYYLNWNKVLEIATVRFKRTSFCVGYNSSSSSYIILTSILTLNIVHTYFLCLVLKNTEQCIVSCYATNYTRTCQKWSKCRLEMSFEIKF
jgi:hypothetical protein